VNRDEIMRALQRFKQPDSNTCSSGWTFETVDAELKEVDGTQINVAKPSALYRLKKGTVRLQDRTDAEALRERFNLKDEN
jgi:hypothetical protein